MRYKNWVKRHLAQGKRVRGFIISQHLSDRIRYTVADDPEVQLREYELTVTPKPVPGLTMDNSGHQ